MVKGERTNPHFTETGTAQIEGISPRGQNCLHMYLTHLGTIPGMHIVDTINVLDRLPMFLKPWKRRARARFQRDWDWCQEKLEVGLARPKFTKFTY